MRTIIFLKEYSDIQDYVKYVDGILIHEEEDCETKTATVKKLKQIMKNIQKDARNALSTGSKQRPNSGSKPASPVCIFHDRYNNSPFSLFKAKRSRQKMNTGEMNQYVGIVYHKEEEEEYFLCIRSRFEGESSFFTEYILSKVMESWGFSFDNRQLQDGDMLEAIKQLLTIVFLHQIDQHYRASTTQNSKNVINAMIMCACRGLVQEGDKKYISENDTVWFRQAIKDHKRIQDYISDMNKHWRPGDVPDMKKCYYINPYAYGFLGEAAQTAFSILCLLNSKSTENMTTGILFDMNYLWELYLQCVFKKYCSGIGYQLSYQKRVDYLFPFAEKQSAKKEIRPDFCLRKKNQCDMVFDAKNKWVWAEAVNTDTLTFIGNSEDKYWGNVNIRSDIYEVLAYMYVLDCPVGGIICPLNTEEKEDDENTKDEKPEKSEDHIVIYQINKNKSSIFFVAGLPVDWISENQIKIQEKSEARMDLQRTLDHPESVLEISKTCEEYRKYKDIMRKREEELREAIIKAAGIKTIP